MGKREVSMFAAQLEGVDLDAPRAKRHKTAASSPVAVKEEGGTTNDAEITSESHQIHSSLIAVEPAALHPVRELSVTAASQPLFGSPCTTSQSAQFMSVC